MLKLTDYQKDIITCTGSGKIEILGQKYFFKESEKDIDGVELLVEALANLVDVNCASYERIVINSKSYVLSKDIAGDEDFKTASVILGKENTNSSSLYNIWHILEQKYPSDVERIMYEIIKIYIFDFIVLNPDRIYNNWGIRFSEGKVDKVFILDNEESFNNLSHAFLDSHSDWDSPIKSQEIENLINLDYFFNTSSSEFIELFKSMYNILNPEAVKSIFEQVEKEIGNGFKFNLELFKAYFQNYNEIGNLLNRRGLK